MPWIECHHDFPDHPKTLHLARLLRCSQDRAGMGLLRFWIWCLDYASDGDLRKQLPAQIARACRYPPSRGQELVSAMIESGWLDVKPYFRVHNWWKHAGAFLQSRHRRQPELWKRIRFLYEETPFTEENPEILPEMVENRGIPASAVQVQHMDSTGTVHSHRTIPHRTLQDSTKQNHLRHPHIPLLREEGGGGGGGFEDLRATIKSKAGMTRISGDDEAKLMDLYCRHGTGMIEACTYLHSGVANVPAYLKAILEKRSRLEVIAEKARQLLRAEGKEVD